jgi:hypothetical protein
MNTDFPVGYGGIRLKRRNRHSTGSISRQLEQGQTTAMGPVHSPPAQ